MKKFFLLCMALVAANTYTHEIVRVMIDVTEGGEPMHHMWQNDDFTVNFDVTCAEECAKIKADVACRSSENAENSCLETSVPCGMSETLLVKYNDEVMLEVVLVVNKAECNRCMTESVTPTPCEAVAC